MSVSLAAGAARLGIATLGITLALAAMSQPSIAQDSAKPVMAPAPAAAGDAAAKAAKGKELFANYGCGGCHALADANATGHVGPAFDGDSNLTEAFIVNRVTNGQGAMPAFGGQLTEDEIAQVAAYVNHAASR